MVLGSIPNGAGTMVLLFNVLLSGVAPHPTWVMHHSFGVMHALVSPTNSPNSPRSNMRIRARPCTACSRWAPKMAAEIGHKEEQYPLFLFPLPFRLSPRKIVTLISTHHAYSLLFYLLLKTIGQKEVPPQELWEKAIANGYKQGAYRAEDSKRDSMTYVPKTLRDQNGALKRYKK